MYSTIKLPVRIQHGYIIRRTAMIFYFITITILLLLMRYCRYPWQEWDPHVDSTIIQDSFLCICAMICINYQHVVAAKHYFIPEYNSLRLPMMAQNKICVTRTLPNPKDECAQYGILYHMRMISMCKQQFQWRKLSENVICSWIDSAVHLRKNNIIKGIWCFVQSRLLW